MPSLDTVRITTMFSNSASRGMKVSSVGIGGHGRSFPFAAGSGGVWLRTDADAVLVREHRAMIDALHARGMGHLVDFVPNHMGIGTENPWWYDILTWGSLSPYSHFFDIEWHKNSNGRGKVVLPVLGDHYGSVVQRGELTVTFDAPTGTLTLHYFDHRFPLTPPTGIRQAAE